MRSQAGVSVHASRFGLALLLLAAASVGAWAEPTGVWRDKDGGTIRVEHCGADFCAAVASVNPPRDPATGQPWTDKHNPDATKRSRPLIGVPVLVAMKPSGTRRWSGTLYDTDTGRTLNGNLVEIDSGTIRIEGCIMAGLCGGEELRRVRR